MNPRDFAFLRKGVQLWMNWEMWICVGVVLMVAPLPGPEISWAIPETVDADMGT